MATVRYSCEGLPTGGVLVSEIRDEVTETTVCKYFGPKSSKSGWRYQHHTTDAEQAAILSLYQRVYGAEEPPNKEITLSFAKGLILMHEGKSVNWAQFAAERKKVREALRKKSESRKERERERETLSEGTLSAETRLGKKRFQDIGLPGSVRLSVKTECDLEGLAMGKKYMGVKGSAKGVKSVGGLGWEREEIESMVRAIEYHEGLAGECKILAAESRKELLAVEDKLRREKLLLSDRQLMLDEVNARLKSISEEELPLTAALKEKYIAMDCVSLAEIGGTLGEGERRDAIGLQKQIDGLKSKKDAMTLQKASDQLTVRVCVKDISGCTNVIEELEGALQKTSETNRLSESRVSCLESVLGSMREQLRKMHVGDGAALYPRPPESSPQEPLVHNHALNACPVCSLWYSSYDYSSLACGHTYHPFCLFEYAQRSSKCLVLDCEEPFSETNLLALGIRSGVCRDSRPTVTLSASKDVNGKSSTQTESGATAGAPASPTPSWAKESPSRITPLSQSSQTDVTSKKTILAGTEKTQSTEMCDICKKREASVFVKGCGHDVFCLVCVQGLELCPICGAKVTGWGRLNLVPKPSPFLKAARPDSGHVRREAVVQKDAPEEENSDGPEEESPKAGRDGDLDSSDDSDSDNGFVHWCGSEEFSNGGTRSGQDCVQGDCDDSEEEEEEDANPPISTAPATKMRTKSRFAAVSTLLESEEGEQGELKSRPLVRKRGLTKCPTENPVQKFKKIAHMAAEDNVGPEPSSESPTNGTCEAVEVPRKKKVGRPPKASKLASRKKEDVSPVTKQTGAMKEVASGRDRCRTTPRRREMTLDSIPVKFRGL